MNNASLVKFSENLCMLKMCKCNADLYGLTTKIYFLVALHEFKLNSDATMSQPCCTLHYQEDNLLWI